MIKCIVFDFDGTLIDSNDLKKDLFLRLAKSEANGERTMNNILKFNSIDRYKIWELYAKELNMGCKFAEEKTYRFCAEVREAVAAASEIEGASELLKNIKSKEILIFISSLTPMLDLLQELERRDWSKYVSKAYGSPSNKPTTLKEIMKNQNLTRKEVIVVGDGVDDKESALKNGVTFFPVGEARGVAPTDTIFKLSELAALINQLNSNEEHFK